MRPGPCLRSRSPSALRWREPSCTVASTRRLVFDRRADWLLGLFVAISWAGATLLVLALAAPSRFNFPAALPISLQLVAGSIILGIGALLNQGCFLGSVARLGQGNLRYVLTLLGIAAALRLVAGPVPGPRMVPGRSPMDALLAVRVSWFACIAVLGFAIMLLYSLRKLARSRSGAMPALVAVGIFGAAIYVVDPDWSYSSVLDRVAHGRLSAIWSAEVGAGALFAGAILSSLLRSRFTLAWPSPRAAIGSLMGGFLLGAGARLIPGGNDTLMLWSVPGLAAYGLVAYLIMIATIAAVLLLLRSASARMPGRRNSQVSMPA